MSENLSNSALNQTLQAEQVIIQGQLPPNQAEQLGGIAVMHNENGERLAGDEGWDFGDEAEANTAAVQEPNQYAKWDVWDSFDAPQQTIQLPERTLDGITYYSNLPEGDWFEPQKPGSEPVHPYNRRLLPSAIDGLPAGTYYRARGDKPAQSDPSLFNESWDKPGTIIVTDEPDGKRINTIAGKGLAENKGKPHALMTALGYKYDEALMDSGTPTEHIRYNSLKAIPTPETLRAKAAELGVDIRFFPDKAAIPGKEYLETFEQGQFPVSTMSAEYYTHDTTDDHLTAMVLGGDTLKAELKASAALGLRTAQTESDIYDWAANFDQFTAALRGAVSPTGNFIVDAQGKAIAYDYNRLREFGQNIGMSDGTVRAIYDTARENAAKWGMDLNPPPVSLNKADYALGA